MAERPSWSRGGLSFIAVFLLGACQPQSKSNAMLTQSSWLATETAPKDYPAFVVNALFVLQGGAVEGIPDDRFTNGGWGSTGALQIIGSDEKAFPTELRAEWFDLVSRKGYKGAFPLPADLLAGMMRQLNICEERGLTRSS